MSRKHLLPRRTRTSDGFLWALALLGAIPFIGFAVRGSWSQSELGFGAAVLLFSVFQLWREHHQRRDDRKRRE